MAGPTAVTKTGRRASRRLAKRVLLAAPLLSVSWALMWTQDTFWNPLFFTGIWVGATLLLYALGRKATLAGAGMAY
jgi:hypothetical protein